MACSKIPYAMKQGIILTEQGIIFAEQGILARTGNLVLAPIFLTMSLSGYSRQWYLRPLRKQGDGQEQAMAVLQKRIALKDTSRYVAAGRGVKGHGAAASERGDVSADPFTPEARA
jgi:hypothetical protein